MFVAVSEVNNLQYIQSILCVHGLKRRAAGRPVKVERIKIQTSICDWSERLKSF